MSSRVTTGGCNAHKPQDPILIEQIMSKLKWQNNSKSKSSNSFQSVKVKEKIQYCVVTQFPSNKHGAEFANEPINYTIICSAKASLPPRKITRKPQPNLNLARNGLTSTVKAREKVTQ